MEKKYTKKMAEKAVWRWARRSVEERLTLLRSLMCEAAFDKEPVYSGIDPNTGLPYAGNSMNVEMADMLGYFSYKHIGIDRLLETVRTGYYRAKRHDDDSRRYYEREAAKASTD